MPKIVLPLVYLSYKVVKECETTFDSASVLRILIEKSLKVDFAPNKSQNLREIDLKAGEQYSKQGHMAAHSRSR